MKLLYAGLATAMVLGAVGSATAAELKSVGVTVGQLGNPFFVQIGEGAMAAAQEIGGDGVSVTVLGADYDLNRQTNQIDDFISADVDMIILGAADSAGIAPAVRRAREAGIPVIAVDVSADGADATVMSDNIQAGEQACQYLVDRLGGKGDIVIINGPPVSSIIDRVAGCKSVLANYPDINVLSDNQNGAGSREGGLESMTALLTAFPKIDAVFAINDPTGIGADLAARQAQRDEFFIVGVDGSPDGVSALNDEKSRFAATPAQDPYTMAMRSVEVGWDILQGGAVPEAPILIPVQLITHDNVAGYKGWTSE